MGISDRIPTANIVLDLKAGSKRSLLQTLAAALSPQGFAHSDSGPKTAFELYR